MPETSKHDRQSRPIRTRRVRTWTPLVAVAVSGCFGAGDDGVTGSVQRTTSSRVDTSGSSDTSAERSAGAGTVDDAQTTVDLPPVRQGVGSATDGFLAGDGAPLIALLDIARPLAETEEPHRATCDAVLATLAEGLPPDQLGGLAGDVPDEVLSGALLEVVVATDEYLTTCANQGDPTTSATSRLQTAVGLADQRLAEL